MTAGDNQKRTAHASACCAVTGLPVIQRPEWTYGNPDTDYRVTVSVLGARVVLSQPSGQATRKDVRTATGIIDRAVAETIAPETPYIAVEDYTRLKGVSISGRKCFIDYLRKKRRIAGLIFCGGSPLFNMSIRLGKYLYAVDFPVRIAQDCAEGLGDARRMLTLDDRPAPRNDTKNGHISSHIDTRPEWHLRLDGFSVRYGVMDGCVIHAVSKGALRECHIAPIVDMMQTVYRAMGSPMGACYCLNDVRAVQSSTRRARTGYYRAIEKWFSEHPGFRMYVFSGASRQIRVAIRLTSALSPFTVHTARNMEAAVDLISRDRSDSSRLPAVFRATKTEKDTRDFSRRYVDELLHYLGSVDLEDGPDPRSRPVDPAHPFLPVFDGIDLVRSELGAVLRERNDTARTLDREKRLSESIIDHIPAGIAFLDNRFVLRKYNRSYARFLELYTPYMPEQCLGMSCFDYVPGSRNQLEQWYRTVRDTGTAETRHNFRLDIQKNGQMLATYWDRSVAPVLDAEGKVEGLLIMTTDVTERRMAERETENLKDQLRQAQKMESLGTLAGGIAHDFNNILSAILGYTEISLTSSHLDTGLKKNLEKIFQAGKRASDLVRQILAFSRQSRPEMKPFGIATVVREALQLLRASVPATIDIRTDIRTEAVLTGDATQIHQVLMNLCTNAAQAMEAGTGVMSVSVEDVDAHGSPVEKVSAAAAGTHVRIRVSDTGSGIPQGAMERIFDPYFTTKKKGRGTGLGLAVVHGIVKSHGGTIRVESRPATGSTFTVLLPADRHPEKTDDAPGGPLPEGTERILLVDDEETLVEAGKQLLQRLGYHITVRTGSVAALALFREKSDRFDLVITDMTMPDMTGIELAEQIRLIRPDLPVILCTGFSQQITQARAEELGISAFINKPIPYENLARTVRKVLDTATDRFKSAL